MQSIFNNSRGYQSLAFVCALPFAYLGVMTNPIYFSAVFLIAGGAIIKRDRKTGCLLGAFGILYFVLLSGYGIGKGMALRDNARTACIVNGAES